MFTLLLFFTDITGAESVTFSGESYVMYRVSVPMERRLHLQLDVRTVQHNAMLMKVEGIVDYSVLEVKVY